MLEGKIIVVSGIGPGMGRDISLGCAREGADIVLAARTSSKLERLAPEIEALGQRTLSIPTDVTNPEQCHTAQLRQPIEVNLFGTLAMTQAVIPAMR